MGKKTLSASVATILWVIACTILPSSDMRSCSKSSKACEARVSACTCAMVRVSCDVACAHACGDQYLLSALGNGPGILDLSVGQHTKVGLAQLLLPPAPAAPARQQNAEHQEHKQQEQHEAGDSTDHAAHNGSAVRTAVPDPSPRERTMPYNSEKQERRTKKKNEDGERTLAKGPWVRRETAEPTQGPPCRPSTW